MRIRQSFPALLIVLSGCSGAPNPLAPNLHTPNLLTTTSIAPKLAEISDALAQPLPPADSVLAHKPPTEVYSEIAQQALTCWTGPKGPFHKSHLFHADAASPTTGGKAEIGLHERDTTQKHPWGSRIFRVELTPEGGGVSTRVDMQNLKLPRDLADALRQDVITWSEGRQGCQAQVVRPPAPETTVKPTNTKTKPKKTKQA